MLVEAAFIKFSYEHTTSSCFSNFRISDKCTSLNKSPTVEDWGLPILSSVKKGNCIKNIKEFF